MSTTTIYREQGVWMARVHPGMSQVGSEQVMQTDHDGRKVRVVIGPPVKTLRSGDTIHGVTSGYGAQEKRFLEAHGSYYRVAEMTRKPDMGRKHPPKSDTIPDFRGDRGACRHCGTYASLQHGSLWCAECIQERCG